MTTFEELFRVEGEGLKKDVDYVTEGFYLDIVENISRAMARTKMKKKDLAAAMKVSPGRVTNLLRGTSRNLEIRTIVQAALALGIQPHELCARRKTAEALKRPFSLIPGFKTARLIGDKQNGATEAA